MPQNSVRAVLRSVVSPSVISDLGAQAGGHSGEDDDLRYGRGHYGQGGDCRRPATIAAAR